MEHPGLSQCILRKRTPEVGRTMSDGRREFLKKMAQGTVYAVPLIYSLTAPRGLAGQGGDTMEKGTSTGKNKHEHTNMQTIEDLGTSGFSPAPPWSKPPGG
jgi:hypothetical protein